MVAIERLGVALAVVLLYTAPIWVLAVRAAFSRSVRRSDAAAVAMAVAGVALIYLPSSSAREAIWDIAWGLASGLLYAALIVGSWAVLEKAGFLKGRLTPAAAAISVQGWAAPSLALAVALSGASVGRGDVASGLYLGLVSSVVAYYLFYEGLSRVPPERVSVAATLEPLLGVFWGVLLLGEAMGLSRALGAALVILSQLFISLARQDSSRVPS
jgi:drug/metabolite transporter (DMT)-like permease